MHPELQALEDKLDAASLDAKAAASGLGEECGCWRPQLGSWSVAECLEHLANTNRVYLDAMQPAALRAQEQGSRRRRPALPGFAGRLFIAGLEPPVKLKMRAPRIIRPVANSSLADALTGFTSSQDEVRAFLRAYADSISQASASPTHFCLESASVSPRDCT
jgi:DinB superfamily